MPRRDGYSITATSQSNCSRSINRASWGDLAVCAFVPPHLGAVPIHSPRRPATSIQVPCVCRSHRAKCCLEPEKNTEIVRLRDPPGRPRRKRTVSGYLIPENSSRKSKRRKLVDSSVSGTSVPCDQSPEPNAECQQRPRHYRDPSSLRSLARAQAHIQASAPALNTK